MDSQSEDSFDGSSESEVEFEDQGSSDEEELIAQQAEYESEEDIDVSVVQQAERSNRSWVDGKQVTRGNQAANTSIQKLQQALHLDDLSSDDEDADGNTIGRVPLHWYDAYDHIGYNIAGEKLAKQVGRDRLDNAIANKDDPDSSRTVYDMYNDKHIVLSERDFEIIRRLQSGAIAHPEHNDTPDYVDYVSSVIEEMPIMAAPEPKRRFVSSKWEKMRVMKIAKAIKEGRYVFKKDLDAQKAARPPLSMIWNDTEDDVLAESKRNRFHLPAPKVALPGHAESYNPPAEYLLSAEEQKAWEEMDPSERPNNFIPKKYTTLRHVPGYDNFIKERFERCLDLYLCPRKLKRRLNIDPESLVPRLPKPRELKPFPNKLCLQFIGHTKSVRCIAVSPDGQYMVSGSDDGTIRLWELDTSLCRQIWKVDEPVVCVAWNPVAENHVVAAATGSRVVLIATGTGDKDSCDVCDSFLSTAESKGSDSVAEVESSDGEDSEAEDASAPSSESNLWFSLGDEDDADKKRKNSSQFRAGLRVMLKLSGPVTHIAWHFRGDYIVALVPTAGSMSVSVHQVSKASSQFPFKKKSPGNVQSVQFHPSRPFLFVATQQHVKVFDLLQQRLVKRLLSGCKWISSMDIHHSGDHVIIGSYDRRVVWFDLDLSSTPYKTLKFHEKAIRALSYHRKYPLMASASDDGSIHVFHSTVYSDLMRNPLIVPLKVLRGHGVKGGLGVQSIAFHPRQPWLISGGVDGVINLYQDI